MQTHLKLYIEVEDRDPFIRAKVISSLRKGRNNNAVWDAFRAGWIDKEEVSELLVQEKEDDTLWSITRDVVCEIATACAQAQDKRVHGFF